MLERKHLEAILREYELTRSLLWSEYGTRIDGDYYGQPGPDLAGAISAAISAFDDGSGCADGVGVDWEHLHAQAAAEISALMAKYAEPLTDEQAQRACDIVAGVSGVYVSAYAHKWDAAIRAAREVGER